MTVTAPARHHHRAHRPGRRLALALLATAALGSSSTASPTTGIDYGAGISLTQKTPLAELVEHPERFADEPVLTRGRITDVCQKKGCWTVLAAREAVVRVRFHDYSFFLPKDVAGREALVEGRVRVETLDEETARHYAAESSNEAPAVSEGPQRVVGFVATGLRLLEREHPTERTPARAP